jgi:hypothetical protein
MGLAPSSVGIPPAFCRNSVDAWSRGLFFGTPPMLLHGVPPVTRRHTVLGRVPSAVFLAVLRMTVVDLHVMRLLYRCLSVGRPPL